MIYSPESVIKKRIVLLTDCLADLAGGAEKQIYELAKRLNKDKYEVFVVSLDCSGKASHELIESTGSRLFVFRVVRIYGWSGFVQGLRFFKFLKENRIDILMTYHFSSDIWGAWWAHWAGTKMILSNRRDMGFWRKPWHAFLYRLVNPWVKKIVVVAHSVKDMVMKTERVAASRIETVYNGVELPPRRYALKKSDIGLNEEDVPIMHVANLKPIKGHESLLKAFVNVVTRVPRAKLVLIGKDEMNGELKRMAKALGLERYVIFLGKRDDVADILDLADICILTSLSEGMSNAVLEYMAAGKPIIATNVGGNPELVTDGVNGYLVAVNDVEQMRNALLGLLADPAKRTLMGQNSLSRIRTEFAMERMMAHYDRIFRGLRVLHLVSSGGMYGAERVILNLSAQSNEITSFVGALNNHHNSHLEVLEQAKSLGINNVAFPSRGKMDFKTIGLVRRFLKDNDIDIIHSHNYKSDIISFWASRFTRTKWVATNHVWHGTDGKLRIYEAFDAFVLKFAEKVVSVSAEIRNDLLRRNFKAQRLEIIDNGIPIAKFNAPSNSRAMREKLGIKPADCAVVIVGRLAVEKGHSILLKAARKVVHQTPDVKFVIVGDGPLLQQLKEEVAGLNLSDYVIFTGVREDMPAVYGLADILVNSSFIEGLPMTILEAMASKLPIIATKVGAIVDVIEDHRNGILIDAGDVNALSDAILELYYNRDKRRQLAEQSYQDVCLHFSDTRMAQRYHQVYCQIG